MAPEQCLDETGRVVIPAKYGDVSHFEGGLARVEFHSCAATDMMWKVCT